jgi:uncharacterized protein YegL
MPDLKSLEFADNPDQRCACVLLLDTSGSMAGQRITDLNTGLRTLKEDLLKDSNASTRVDLAVMTFDSQVKVVRDFGNVQDFEPPALTAQYQTFIGTAICDALERIEARKAEYRNHGVPYYRPWLFILTDGHPEGESPEVVNQAKQRLKEAQDAHRVKVFPVAVGDGVDIALLSDLAGTPALRMKETKFQDLFQWLSKSLTAMSNSKDVRAQVALPPPSWQTA